MIQAGKCSEMDILLDLWITLYTMIRLSSALTPALSSIIGIIPVPL